MVLDVCGRQVRFFVTCLTGTVRVTWVPPTSRPCAMVRASKGRRCPCIDEGWSHGQTRNPNTKLALLDSGVFLAVRGPKRFCSAVAPLPSTRSRLQHSAGTAAVLQENKGAVFEAVDTGWNSRYQVMEMFLAIHVLQRPLAGSSLCWCRSEARGCSPRRSGRDPVAKNRAVRTPAALRTRKRTVRFHTLLT